MEKIFEKYRYTIRDDGFSEGVMERIAEIGRPSKNSYRTPTLLTAIATVAAIVVLTLTVGLDVIGGKYQELAHHSRVTIYEIRNNQIIFYEVRDGLSEDTDEAENMTIEEEIVE